LNISIENIKKILEEALRGNEFSEIYYENSTTNKIILEDSKINKLDTGIGVGVGIRIVNGEKTIYGHTNNVTYQGLMELAQKLNIINKDKEKIKINSDYKMEKAKSDIKKTYNQVEIERKIELLKNGDKLAREITEKEIVQVSAIYSDTTKEIFIINSEGKYVSEIINRGILRYSVILKEEKNVQTGYASTGTSLGFEHFEGNKYEDLVREAVRSAEVMLSAKPSISGKMNVIIAGKAGGTMIHEACGHGLELDLVQDEISIYKGKMDKKVANKKVSVIDSGIEPGLFGTTFYDGEGNKTKKNILIEKGILKKYMNNYITGKKENLEISGNGRRQSYKSMPIPRMTNTYIAPGNDKLEDMLKQIDRGVYVSKMGGGQVDTITGDFVFTAIESYLVENGEIKYPLKNITLTGNGKDVLHNITAVSDDLCFIIGTCGKAGQGVPVTTGQPTIMIKDIIVGGME